MKKALILLAAISLAWFHPGSGNVAYAHGGTYRGPAGEVPPGRRDPTDPQPPPVKGPATDPPRDGPGTKPPDGESSGGGSDGPASPPERPTPPGANPAPPGIGEGGTGPRTGPDRRGPAQMGYENWLFWWAYNKDEILNLKASLARAHRVRTSRAPIFLGEGETGNRDTPTERQIEDLVVPALEAAVRNEALHPDIRGGALIALARCRGTDHVETFIRFARRDVDEDALVKESALLALGIAQTKSPAVREFLLSVVDDAEYPSRGRCFAMLSLGLLNDNSPEVFACLERRLDGRESNRDVPVCSLLAIGLVADNGKVPELESWLAAGRIGTFRFGELERAWVIGALGRIGDPAAVSTIQRELRQKGLYPRRAAMIAMGQMVPNASGREQAESVRQLGAAIDHETDLTARNFGLIALGRIGGSPTAPPELTRAIVRVLGTEFENSNKVMVRPFAALALGLIGFGENKPEALRYEIAGIIRPVLAALRGDKSALGAQAIALGMLGDDRPETVDLLVSILSDRTLDRRLRGSAAMALGLIGAPAGRDAVQAALTEREDRALRVDAAVAAGLLGDSRAVPALVSVLNDPKASQFVLGSVALALGQVGDAQAAALLVGMLEPEKQDGAYPDLTRALIAVALGQIADRSDVRVLSRISRDVNYRATVPALDEILSIL